MRRQQLNKPTTLVGKNTLTDMKSHRAVNYLCHFVKSHAKLEDFICWWWKCAVLILLMMFLPTVILLYPVFLIVEAYIIALYLKAYRCLKSIFQEFTPESWEAARRQFAYLMSAQARFWNGYEIKGAENIPSEGPALIVFYHGAFPIDCFYFLADIFLRQNRLLYIIAERLLFKIPGVDAAFNCFVTHPGTVDYCVDKLQNGNLMIIAPGGTREALFDDERYQMLWGKRTGFAKAAFRAKVPIIPIFTKNIREAFPTSNFGKSILRSIYEKFKLPIPIIYGGFPVKLTTFVGEPIPYDPTSSAEEMAEKVKQSMRDLISLHQPTPGSAVRGVKERIQHFLNRKHSKFKKN